MTDLESLASQNEANASDGTKRPGRRLVTRLPRMLGLASGWKLPFAYMLIAPAALFYFVFQLLPALLAGIISLFNWNGISIAQMKFVGLSNYFQLVHDPLFTKVLVNNLIIVVAVLVFQCGGGFILAVGIYAGIPGGRIFRRLMIVPVAVAPVAVGVIGMFVLSPQYGLVDAALKSAKLGQFAEPWIGSPRFALAAVIVTYVFQNVGLTVLLFLAALQQVDESMLEAARVDGAAPLTLIRRIIAPTIQPVAGIVVLLAMANAFRLFDVAYVLTGGGPYYSSSTLVIYLYDLGFTQFQVGYADAVGVVIFLIIFALAAIQLTIMRATAGSSVSRAR